MDIKRIARGPVLWILLALVLLLVATSVMSDLRGPAEVSTSQAVNPSSRTRSPKPLLIDKDQRLNLTLNDGTQQTSQYITGQGVGLQNLLQTSSTKGN